jgi:hypothetical protein
VAPDGINAQRGKPDRRGSTRSRHDLAARTERDHGTHRALSLSINVAGAREGAAAIARAPLRRLLIF